MTATAQQPEPKVDAPPSSTPRSRAIPPRLADGVQLIGPYEGSGFKKPPLLARRADGQMVQLTKPLYAIAALVDGRRDVATIAAVLTHASNRVFTAEHVQTLIDRRLRPAGVLARADGSSPQVPKREALMALRHRRPLLPEKAVNVLAAPFTVLHKPFVTGLVVLALITFDVWLFGFHGVAPGLRSAIYNPVLLLAVVGSVIVATAFHEIGHASACRYSGGRPGVMGVGFYLVYPAFYCDVTDAYRLKRSGRLRTDLGGVYFNGIFALLAGAVYFVTGEEAALFTAAVMHLIMLQQLLPLMRFDGYYVLTDLTGVPDILSRIKPIFRSLVRGRDNEPRVAELKPWVRVVVTAYLVTLVPTLVFLFVWMVMGAPRVIATVHDSFGLQVDRFQSADGWAESGVAVVSILALVLPVAGMALSLTRVGRMVGGGLARWSSGRPVRRAGVVLVGSAVVAALAYVWWPNGDYEPIAPGERGIVSEVLEGLPGLAEGRALAPGEAVEHPYTPVTGHDDETSGPEGRDHRRDSGGGDGARPRTDSVQERDTGADGTRESTQEPTSSETSGTTTEPTTSPESAPSTAEPSTTDSSAPEPSPEPTTTDPSPTDTGSTAPDTTSSSLETGTSSDTSSTSPDTAGTTDTSTTG